MASCTTKQVKQENDKFIVGGMEEPRNIIVVHPQTKSQKIDQGKAPQIKIPPGYQLLRFETPSGLRTNLFIPHHSRAIGKPNNGRLLNGTCLRDTGPGYEHFGPNSCGTDQTVALLMFALGRLRKVYPDTPPLVIGSLSAPNGGKIPPHHSHQNGLDVDIGYIPVRDLRLKSFRILSPSEIDFDRTFYFMAVLLSTGKVKYIFVDYELQKYLYRAAQNMGYSDYQLDIIFQYPAQRYKKKGVIRYSPGHRNHFHVRFLCPAGDVDCVE